MASREPVRGAGVVDRELEVGYDEGFERHWRRTELLAHGLMTLIVLICAAGFLGRGPANHRTEHSNDGRIAVDFERLVRYGTTTQVTIHLVRSPGTDVPGAGDRVPAPAADTAQLFVSSEIAEPMGLQQVIPMPLRQQLATGGLR